MQLKQRLQSFIMQAHSKALFLPIATQGLASPLLLSALHCRVRLCMYRVPMRLYQAWQSSKYSSGNRLVSAGIRKQHGKRPGMRQVISSQHDLI